MMKKAISVGLVVLGLVGGKGLWAETYVSGTITSNTIWNQAGSPYIATDTVTVANGVVLTINPGVTVRFATETSLICIGSLNAVGTPVGTITFTSDQDTHTAGYWNGIKISGAGANGSQISHCDIGYAEQAVYLKNVSGVTIIHNYIHNNKGRIGTAYGLGGIGCGIYLSESNNNFIGTNTVSSNTGGQGGPTGNEDNSGSTGGIGCGIYLSLSTVNTFLENTISGNTGGKGGSAYTGFGGDGSGGLGGIGCGIYLSSSINNAFSQTTIADSVGGQGGVGGGGCIWWDGPPGAPGQEYGIYIDPNSYNNIINFSNT
ncbi:MAG: right-handed parallel beta-helix repeat-containing protein [bacterium]|nr:right-handed parallel beta-helix repeat-containing protein [bacterium]